MGALLSKIFTNGHLELREAAIVVLLIPKNNDAWRQKFFVLRTWIFLAEKSSIYVSIFHQNAGVDRRKLFYFPPP